MYRKYNTQDINFKRRSIGNSLTKTKMLKWWDARIARHKNYHFMIRPHFYCTPNWGIRGGFSQKKPSQGSQSQSPSQPANWQQRKAALTAIYRHFRCTQVTWKISWYANHR